MVTKTDAGIGALFIVGGLALLVSKVRGVKSPPSEPGAPPVIPGPPTTSPVPAPPPVSGPEPAPGPIPPIPAPVPPPLPDPLPTPPGTDFVVAVPASVPLQFDYIKSQYALERDIRVLRSEPFASLGLFPVSATMMVGDSPRWQQLGVQLQLVVSGSTRISLLRRPATIQKVPGFNVGKITSANIPAHSGIFVETFSGMGSLWVQWPDVGVLTPGTYHLIARFLRIEGLAADPKIDGRSRTTEVKRLDIGSFTVEAIG